MPQQGRAAGKQAPHFSPLHDKKGTVQQAPDDKIPTGSVPESAQEKDQKEVERSALFAAPVSAQRDIQVVSEPAGKGNVPPAPELAERAGDVGIIEVDAQLKAEKSPKADGHVRVAGKVKIDLQAIGKRSAPGE